MKKTGDLYKKSFFSNNIFCKGHGDKRDKKINFLNYEDDVPKLNYLYSMCFSMCFNEQDNISTIIFTYTLYSINS